MAVAQRELVHGLVERSHDRVTQARAGQSLPRILRRAEGHASLPQLPAASSDALASSALVFNARANERRAQKLNQDNEAMPKVRRPGVLAVSSSLQVVETLPRAHLHATSQQQFQEYVHEKSCQTQSLRPKDRRLGVLPQAKELRKLVEHAHAEQQVGHESAKAKLARAMAKLRGHGAFLQAHDLSLPPATPFEDIKNPHLAFLEFKREAALEEAATAKHRRVHPSAGLEDGNTSKKIPLHYGDQICLISTVSHLPLAVGPDGRSHSASSTAVGPHMTFTIVDFRHPSRRDEITLQDAFWLRIDPSALQDCGTVDNEDDLESLLVDTNHYLGCPGWLDTECTQHAAQSKRRRRGRGHKLFRLVAMKALTPSLDYYGDDIATREYAIETNENIVRLARWTALLQPHHSQKQAGFPPVHVLVEDNALLNCSLIQLSQDHNFTLMYDEFQSRGVCRPNSRERVEAAPGTRRKAEANASAPLNSIWQVRLLHRDTNKPVDSRSPGLLDDEGDDPATRWLREKQAQVTATEDKLLEKTGLAQLAREQFERVATQSNNKLAEIEKLKDQRAPGYFLDLLQATSASPAHKAASPTKKASHQEIRLPNLH